MSRLKLWQRVSLAMLAGILIAWGINETTFRFLKRAQDRPPQTIELTIPEGTSVLVAKGQNPPGIPDSMALVVGDVLLVHNEDTTDHQLGPLYIPAKRSASLPLGSVDNYAYACSFRNDNYLGLEVNSALTLSDRIIGTVFSGLPLGILIALYSIIAVPLPEKKSNV